MTKIQKHNKLFLSLGFSLGLILGMFGLAKSSQAVYPVAGRRKLSLKVFLFTFSIFFSGLFFTSPAYGADCTHYVSPTGSASWTSATNINTPTSPTVAFANAVAGNVVCFRGGTYTVPQRNFGDSYSSYYMPAHSGTSSAWITFQAYSGEIPLFNGHKGGSGDNYGENGYIGAKIMGVQHQSYIILDGFSFEADDGTSMAGMTVGGNDELNPPYSTNYVTIQNCNINGGTTVNTGTDNADGIRINSAGHVTVGGNRIYNFNQTDDYPNTAATKAYHTDYVTYENNEIHDSATCIYDKSGGDHNVYRYNYIHDCSLGLHIVTNSYFQTNGQIYHNLITYVADTPIEVENESGASSNNWTVYNNTVYNASAVSGNSIKLYTQDGGSYPTGYSFHNNLVQSSGSDYGGANVRTNLDPSAGMVDFDYNNYSQNISVRLVSGGSGTNYTSISDLRAVAAYNLTAGNHDMHSLAAANIFTNGSGHLNQVSDFALASNSPGHNAGNDGKDMGADISLVGIQGGGSSDTTPPASPTGLSVS